MSDDFPTLDLPMNAYSGISGLGHLDGSVLLIMNSADFIFILIRKWFRKYLLIQSITDLFENQSQPCDHLLKIPYNEYVTERYLINIAHLNLN